MGNTANECFLAIPAGSACPSGRLGRVPAPVSRASIVVTSPKTGSTVGWVVTQLRLGLGGYLGSWAARRGTASD